MDGIIIQVMVLAVVIVTSRAQVINIAGSTSVSLSPTDATCGRTSADSYCRIDSAADASCVVDTCRTVCEDEVRVHAYRDLLRDVSGFNYDGSVTSTTKDLGGGNVTVAVFNRKTRLAFLRGTVDMTTMDEFALSLRIKPHDVDTER